MTQTPHNKSRHRRKKQKSSRTKPPRTNNGTPPLIWGIHAVTEVLKNPRRHIKSLYATPNGLKKIVQHCPKRLGITETSNEELRQQCGGDAVHQGVAVACEPLPAPNPDKLLHARRIVVFDQITDPHNMGAIIRSCASFGLTNIVTARHGVPPLSGVLAKTASGALEHVQLYLVNNLAQTLKQLHKNGFLILGFDSDADTSLMDYTTISDDQPIVLILGAEGKGLRHLTRQHCHHIVRIETNPAFPSLNVSNAAAICLYQFRKHIP